MTIVPQSATWFEQHQQGTRTTFCGFGLNKGHDLVFLNQPTVHLGLEDRGFAGRAQTFAMHHAQATQTLTVGNADEFGQCHAGFVAAQAVQINLTLNGPATFAQLLGHVDADARTPKAQGIVGVEQGTDVKTVTQGIAQNGGFVLLPLSRHRGWRWRADAGLVMQGHALDHPDCTRKQVGLGFALTRCGNASGLFSLGFLVGLSQRFLDFFEVLQGVDFHPLIVPQKDVV
jgi:hypothetical protein